jgi:hypothetical protein
MSNMNNQTLRGMNFEQFLRGKFNARSEKAPKSLSEAVQDPNLPEGIKLFHGGTLKHRVDSLDAYSEGIILGSADESFSIKTITPEQEDRIEEYTRQFYEDAGYGFYKKDSSGLSDSYFFRNNSGDVMVVTYTLPFDDESDRLLVSTTRMNA